LGKAAAVIEKRNEEETRYPDGSRFGVLTKDQELSGIGDKGYLTGAFRGEFMGSTTTISVLKGDVWINIQVIGTPKKGSKEALKAVAKKAADSF
jgi:hypothetical protein